MGLKYDGNAMYSFTMAMTNQLMVWEEEVRELQGKVDNVQESNDFKGKTATALDRYMSESYGVILGTTLEFLSTAQGVLMTYSNKYKQEVDTEKEAVIDLEKIKYLGKEVVSAGKKASPANEDVQTTIRQISDLISLKYRECSYGIRRCNDLDSFINNLVTLIQSVEKEYSSGAEINTLGTLVSTALELTEKALDIKNPGAYEGGLITEKVLNELVPALQQNAQWKQDNADLVKASFDNFLEEDKIRQEEYEARQRDAAIIGAVVLVAGIVATVATAGAAGPVAAVAIGAAVGGASAAINSVAQQRIGSKAGPGTFSWETFGKDVAIGAIEGGIMGGLSYGAAAGTKAVTGVIKSKVSNEIVQKGLTYATKAGIGTIKGTAQAYSFKVVESAFDGKSISESFGEANKDLSANFHGNLAKNLVTAGVGMKTEGMENLVEKGAWTIGGDLVAGGLKRATQAGIKGEDVLEKTFSASDIAEDLLVSGTGFAAANVVQPKIEKALGKEKNQAKIEKKVDKQMKKIDGKLDEKAAKDAGKLVSHDAKNGAYSDKTVDEITRRRDNYQRELKSEYTTREREKITQQKTADMKKDMINNEKSNAAVAAKKWNQNQKAIDKKNQTTFEEQVQNSSGTLNGLLDG